jgi:hypothetical protein
MYTALREGVDDFTNSQTSNYHSSMKGDEEMKWYPHRNSQHKAHHTCRIVGCVMILCGQALQEKK